MKDLRERCEKFMNDVEWVGPEGPLLRFAREIRAEALEEAAELFQSHSSHDLKRVLADALAASEDK